MTAHGEPPIDATSWRALWWFTAAILGTWALHNAFLLPWETAQLPAEVRQPIGLLLRAVVCLIPAAVYLRRHDPRPLAVAWGVTSSIDRAGLLRRGWLVAGYLVVAGFLASTSATPETDTSLRGLGRVLFSSGGAMLVVGVALEELLLRGFLLRQMLRRVSVRRAVLVVAALFALLHVSRWIVQGGFSVGVAVSGGVIFVLGWVLGSVTAASNSLWPATLVHAVNNVLADWLGGA